MWSSLSIISSGSGFGLLSKSSPTSRFKDILIFWDFIPQYHPESVSGFSVLFYWFISLSFYDILFTYLSFLYSIIFIFFI